MSAVALLQLRGGCGNVKAMAPRRVLASTVLIAILALLGQGLTVSHFLFVQHAACPVHAGEMIELSGHAQQAQSLAHDEAGLYANDLEAADCGSHDHCSVLGRRSDAFAVPDSAAVRIADPPRANAIEPELLVAVEVERLAVAPKQSPPHC